MKKSSLTGFILAATLLSGCATTTNPSVSGVERKQFMMLSEQQVVAMSTESYLATLKEASEKKTLNTNAAQVTRVRNISQKLIQQTGHFRQDALQWKWEVNVEQNDQVNAYCMPGGKIMVFSGLIDKLKATDDELAAVIGHEIAHALREHGRERMSIAYAQQAGLVGLAVLAGASKNQNAATVGVKLLPWVRHYSSHCPTAASKSAKQTAWGWNWPHAPVTTPTPLSRYGRKWGSKAAAHRRSFSAPTPPAKTVSPT